MSQIELDDSTKGVIGLISISIIALSLRYYKEVLYFGNKLENNFWNYFVLAIILAFILVISVFTIYFIIKTIVKLLVSAFKKIHYKIAHRHDRENFIKIKTIEIENLHKKEVTLDEKILTKDIEIFRNNLDICRQYDELAHFIPQLKKRLAKATKLLKKLQEKRAIEELKQKEKEFEEAQRKKKIIEEEKENAFDEDENPPRTTLDMFTRSRVVPEQKVYLKDKLDKADLAFLKSEGFIETQKTNINGKKTNYIVFYDRFESPIHLICVKEIVDYLKEFTDEIKIYRTVMPDIVFTANKKEYAIEVETGEVLRDKKKMQNKISLLNKNYKNNWFFFVTNRNMEKDYAKLGKVSTKRNIKFKIRQIFKENKK